MVTHYSPRLSSYECQLALAELALAKRVALRCYRDRIDDLRASNLDSLSDAWERAMNALAAARERGAYIRYSNAYKRMSAMK